MRSFAERRSAKGCHEVRSTTISGSPRSSIRSTAGGPAARDSAKLGDGDGGRAGDEVASGVFANGLGDASSAAAVEGVVFTLVGGS